MNVLLAWLITSAEFLLIDTASEEPRSAVNSGELF